MLFSLFSILKRIIFVAEILLSLRIIFGLRREPVPGREIRLFNVDLNIQLSLPNIKMIKLRSMRWKRHVAYKWDTEYYSETVNWRDHLRGLHGMWSGLLIAFISVHSYFSARPWTVRTLELHVKCLRSWICFQSFLW